MRPRSEQAKAAPAAKPQGKTKGKPGPRHNKPLAPPFNWVYTAIWNVMELPVTQVPLGLNSRGVPLGVQVVAGPFADHRSIAVALHLDQHCRRARARTRRDGEGVAQFEGVGTEAELHGGRPEQVRKNLARK